MKIYAIGTQFKRRSRLKHPPLETVVDVWTTTNLCGEVVRVRYVATHDFLGQTVTDYDVCASTIARNLIDPGQGD